MGSILHVAHDSQFAKEEEYYRALGEITLYKHREKLINELLTYLANVIGDLERSEHRVRAIVDTAADGILSFDGDGRIESANAAAHAIFQAPPGSLLGDRIGSLFDTTAGGGATLLTARGEASLAEEFAGVRRNGEIFPAYVAVARLQLEGSVLFTAIVRDITEQKRAESVLAEAAAKQEVDKILNAIEQGLFLVYARADGYYIGGQYSQATARLLGEEPGEKDLVKLLAARAPEPVIKSVASYLKLMFDQSIFVGSLEQLNPLAEISYQVPGPDGVPAERLLRFVFRRIIENNSVAHLMATVTDVTAEAELRARIQENEKEAQTQMELLFRILHVDPEMLGDFIEEARLEMDLIDSILKEERIDQNLSGRLDAIFRSVHKIKGDADLLGLEFLAQRLHQIEDKLALARRKADLSAADFFPFLVSFAEIVGIIDETSKLVDRLVDFRGRFGERDQARGNADLMVRSFQGLVQKVGRELGKHVRLDNSAFRSSLLADSQRSAARGLITQLLKNAVAHGIESPAERRAAGKSEQANIALRCSINGDRLHVTVSDDGRGLDIERIRRIAVEAGALSADRAAQLSNAQVARLVFLEGVSSAGKADLHAGRGVGMAMIRELVHALGGRLSLRSQSGRGLQVTVDLPRQ